VRSYTSRPGISLNIEQQVTDTLGAFFRAGWADGNIEPWDFTDIDRAVSGGLSFNGKSWGRTDDTIGSKFAKTLCQHRPVNVRTPLNSPH
jgi:high affinity Mn2+ porin